jgi:hypothetical protein
MVETLASGFFYAISIFPVAIAGLAVAYIGLRIRDAKSDPPDPELGIKAAFYTFLTAGILLALTGLSLSIIDFLGEAFEGKQPKQQQPQFNPPFNPRQFPPPPPPPQQPNDPFDRVSQRVAWPLVISGVLFSLVSLLVIKAGTNDARFPAARRTFVGLRLVIAGLNAMVAVTLLIELLFQKDLANTRPYAVAIGLLIVWLPTAAIQLFLFKLYAKQPYFVPPKLQKMEYAEEVEIDDDGDRERRRPRRRRDVNPEEEEHD